MRYHLILVRMSIIKSSNNKCWRGCGEKEPPLYILLFSLSICISDLSGTEIQLYPKQYTRCIALYFIFFIIVTTILISLLVYGLSPFTEM